MVVFTILLYCFLIALYVLGGLVCSRICVEVVRSKEQGYNEFLWFWFGFMFNVVAVLLAILIKPKNNN